MIKNGTVHDNDADNDSDDNATAPRPPLHCEQKHDEFEGSQGSKNERCDVELGAMKQSSGIGKSTNKHSSTTRETPTPIDHAPIVPMRSRDDDKTEELKNQQATRITLSTYDAQGSSATSLSGGGGDETTTVTPGAQSIPGIHSITGMSSSSGETVVFPGGQSIRRINSTSTVTILSSHEDIDATSDLDDWTPSVDFDVEVPDAVVVEDNSANKELEYANATPLKRSLLQQPVFWASIITVAFIVPGIILVVTNSRSNEQDLSTQQPQAQPLEPGQQPSMNSSAAPTPTAVPAPAPSAAQQLTKSPFPTVDPSLSPTTYFFFPPPKEGDCESIAEGKPVEWEPAYAVDFYTIGFNVSYFDTQNTTKTNDWRVGHFKNVSQQYLMPAYCGCTVDRTQREEDTRFVFFFAYAEVESAEIVGNCIGSTSLCYRIELQTKMWMKQDLPRSLINTVAQGFTSFFSKDAEATRFDSSIDGDVSFETFSPSTQ
ncbi:MAG: hypothetical protein SGBAC_005225 [Bacillariaceae sp.]